MRTFPRTYEYTGVCTRVIDGDTIEVQLDLGFHTQTRLRIRLKDVDAPEIFSGPPEVRLRGKVLTSFLRDLLPEGTAVKVTTEKDRQSFNRYVGVVFAFDSFAQQFSVNYAMQNAILARMGEP